MIQALVFASYLSVYLLCLMVLNWEYLSLYLQTNFTAVHQLTQMSQQQALHTLSDYSRKSQGFSFVSVLTSGLTNISLEHGWDIT